jgi:predicted nucleic acid-binding protein
MSSLLQIRDVPEQARRSLKARAAARGQSLNAYLLDMIDREVARPTVADVLDRAARRAERASASALEVVDAAVVDVLTSVDGCEDLRHELAAEELHAPMLLDFEVVSALRGLTFGGHLSAPRSHDAVADFDDLPIHRWPATSSFRLRAFSLRDNLTAHDAAYVVLAEALECPLVTRDARLGRSGGHGAQIRVR